MFIVTNKTEVKRRIRNNRILFWLGVAALAGSMLTLFFSTTSSVASTYAIFVFGYPLLFLGIIFTKRGSYNNRRLGAGALKIPAEEVEIDTQLKGVPSRYHLYNYVNVGGMVIEHLLVTPQGFIILLLKAQMGTLKAGRDLYRLKRGFFGWVGSLGEPGLGNPSTDLSRQAKRLRKWFEDKGYEIPTDGIIVLSNPRTVIQAVEDMTFPVCQINDLRAAVREWQTELNMTNEEQLDLEKLLVQQLPAEEVAEAERQLTMTPAKRAQEKIQAAATEKAVEKQEKPEKRERKQPVNPLIPTPGQRVGLNGKPLAPKPVSEKPKKKSVEPLRKQNPGAFGDAANRKK